MTEKLDDEFANDVGFGWTQIQARRTLIVKSLRYEQEFFKKFIWCELGKLIKTGALYTAEQSKFHNAGKNIPIDFSASPEFYFHKENEENPKIVWLNRKTQQLLAIHNLIEKISKGKSNLTFPY